MESKMSSLPKHRMTVEEYFALESTSDVRHEFINGEIIMMSGASDPHNRVMGSTFASLYAQLRRRPCIVYPSEMRVRVGWKDYTYPDIAVACDEPQIVRDGLDTLLNPTVIIEVLSVSTEQYDRGQKFHLYRTIESLQEYVLISQDAHRIECFVRHRDGKWLYTEAVGIDASMELASISCTLALADVYEKVTFDEPEPGEQE
jgi:Uma2 family endonuclease